MKEIQFTSAYINPSASIGVNCNIGCNVIILENVVIKDSVYIGHNVVIHEGTVIGANTYIDDGSVLGRKPKSGVSASRKASQVMSPLRLGDGCIVGVNAIIYRGTVIGDQCMVGDMASIRENNTIGQKSIIGRLVMMEPNTKIGNNVKIQTGSHITGDAVIEDDVFFGDEVSTTNDNHMGPSHEACKGPYVKRGARIGSNATLLPGITIGQEAVIAAGSVVTRDVPDKKVVMGVPARVVKDINDRDFPRQ